MTKLNPYSNSIIIIIIIIIITINIIIIIIIIIIKSWAKNVQLGRGENTRTKSL